MSDYASELPIRSQYPGQVLSDDVIIKLGDGTNPTTQFASVDTHGSVQSRIADAAGDIMGSQNLSSSYWLQVVSPNIGSASPATASTFAGLAAGEYLSTLPTLTTGEQVALQLNSQGVLLTAPNYDLSPATQAITVQDTGSTSTAEFNQTWITGSATAGSTATFTTATDETVSFEISGTWTGTLEAETSVDGGVTWVATNAHITGSPINTAQYTGNVIAFLNVAAKTQFRIRATAAMTGSATVAIVTSTNEASVYVANPIKLVDANTANEANILAGLMAASTSNTALVVALSPNTPLPAGANNIGFTNSNLYVSGNPVTVSNPVPVTITSASSGTPIQNMVTLTAIAASGNATATYTVPATHTFSFERVWISAEGRIKVIVSNNGTAIYTAFNSSADPNIDITVTAPPTIVAGNSITVQVFNLEAGADNAYVTFEGNQIT
jgi:hypothetical protein